MCLGVPGKILDAYTTGSVRMGRIDYGGVVKEACLAYVPDAAPGDYVLIHAGFALNVLSPDDAEETLKLFREIGEPAISSSPSSPVSRQKPGEEE
ncbi:MAG: HypC/HybG/HupF family hydrogenase formation chaperone [Anaerolineales bacterium]|nr:HypC/HybG/HupF family hydrogenase formation chaperone [Anaerolineales bacterium]